MERKKNKNKEYFISYTSIWITSLFFCLDQSGLVQMPEDFDILDLPDNVLVQYAETMERTYTPRNVPNNITFSGCTVNFNYYGQQR